MPSGHCYHFDAHSPPLAPSGIVPCHIRLEKSKTFLKVPRHALCLTALCGSLTPHSMSGWFRLPEIRPQMWTLSPPYGEGLPYVLSGPGSQGDLPLHGW
jgi:hypothetical protein